MTKKELKWQVDNQQDQINELMSLFEREMQKPSFRHAYESERESFALETQHD